MGRIVASYDERIQSNVKELELARTQLRDYEKRNGQPFTHAGYQEELTGLRTASSSGRYPGTTAEGEPSPQELAERINTLKATHAVEAVPRG